MKKMITFVTTGIVVTLFAATAVSVAGDARQTSANPQITPRRALTDVGSLKLFSTPSSFSPAEARSFAQLKSEVSDYPSDLTAAQVEFSSARPFPIPSGEGVVWIAKSADGGICAFTPQLAPGSPAGFSSACSSLADFNKTGLAALNVGGDDDFVAVSVQPSDVPAPVVLSPDGDSERLPVESDVAVATIEPGDAVSSGGMTLSTYDVDK